MTYPSLFAIQAAVCRQFGVTTLDLMSARRGREVARPRQLAMWLARHTTLLSLPDIGRGFGRDHTTVIHAIKRVEELLRTDPDFAWAALQLRYLLTPREAVA